MCWDTAVFMGSTVPHLSWCHQQKYKLKDNEITVRLLLFLYDYFNFMTMCVCVFKTVCVEFPASSSPVSQLPIVWAESHFLTGQNSRKQERSPNKFFRLHLHPSFIAPAAPRSRVPRKGMFPTGSQLAPQESREEAGGVRNMTGFSCTYRMETVMLLF